MARTAARRSAPHLLFALVLFLGTGPSEAGGKGEYLYVLHCSGCHLRDGSGSPEGRIPKLAGQIGHFMRLPEGRRFVLQIPGVMNSGLEDDEVEALMNWMVPHFAGASLDRTFVPFTADEVAAARSERPADVFATRRRIAAELRKKGAAVEDYQ